MAKVLGVGNALVDLLIHLENDNLLLELNLPKGSMTLVDEITRALIDEKTKFLKREMASGGSAANTIHGLASLGVETAFIGSIGNDAIGTFFYQDMINSHIRPVLKRHQSPSGLASTLISLDGERTFGTYLGAAIELSADDLTPDQFEGYDIVHVEGYIVQNHLLLETILSFARQAGAKISIDLASYNVVEANLEFLRQMVTQYVDIIFANEEEARAFTGKEPEEALHDLKMMADIAVVKIGSKGSLVKPAEAVMVVEPIVANPVDTTGAGDLYAAGFLYGLLMDLGFEKAGYIASLLGGTVINQPGAKIRPTDWDRIRKEVNGLPFL
ncbi:MAG: adenosine kinase [bacterium]